MKRFRWLYHIPRRLLTHLLPLVMGLTLLLLIGGWMWQLPQRSLAGQDVYAQTPITATVTLTPTISIATPTPLPPTATPSNTPTPTATGTPLGWDAYEPNDTFETAVSLAVNQSLPNLTLSPQGDTDTFTLFGKQGQILHLYTLVEPATDTILKLYTQSGTLLAENDDKSDLDLGSSILYVMPQDGWLLLTVQSATPHGRGTYTLALTLEQATQTPTPTAVPTTAPTTVPNPTETSIPPPVALDEYEDNNSPDRATEMVQGTVYEATLSDGDVDWYRFLQKEGNRYQCRTEPSGVDTIVGVYTPDLQLSAENDDRTPEDVGSTVEWVAELDTPVLVQVRELAGRGSYTFFCTAVVPTPRPVNNSGGSAPPANPTVTPTPTPIQPILQYMGELVPTPTPATMQTIRLRVAYDLNNNGVGDGNEGVTAVSVRAISGGRIVGWGLTDGNGEVTLQVSGAVDRLTIPYLGWEGRVRGDGLQTVVIPPVELPALFPLLEEDACWVLIKEG